MKDRKLLRILAILFAFALIAAACGDDDDDTATDQPAEEPADEPAEEPADEPAEEPADEPAEEPADEPADEPAAGGGSADLGPIKVGIINANDLFPDYVGGMESAAEYVTAELGGLDGRDIEISACNIDYGAPDDTQRCANELAAGGVELALVGLNQFGNHFEILNGNGIPVLVGSAVTVPDYTTPDVYTVLAGGGCPGTLTAMTKYVVQELGAKRVAVPYYDIPSGALCFFDNEQKPLDVFKGVVPESTSPHAGTVPDIEYLGVPTPPGGDLTAQASQILDFGPDAIIYSGPSSECPSYVSALEALGWSNDDIPFVMTTSCFNEQGFADLGDAAVGITFVGSSGFLTADPATLDDPDQAEQATTYQTKAIEYGLPEELLNNGFAVGGFTLVMSVWERANEIAASGGQVTGTALNEAFAATQDAPQFGSPNISCADAPEPYITLCSTNVDVNVWNGSGLDELIAGYNAMDMLSGTEIRTESAN